MTMLYTLEDLAQELEWRKIAPRWDKAKPEELVEAFRVFCEKYWYIRHPERGRIHFELYDSQLETIELWIKERYSICLKARQIGFSTLVATYCFWLTFFYPDRAVIMLSKTERDAVKLLDKAKYGARFLPDWIKFRGPVMQPNQTKLTFSNESYLESLPSASDPARGETVFTVVVDEMGQLPNSEEAWAAIEPVADVGGRVIMMGTANGEGNLFHSLWMGSQNGTNRFRGLFFPWYSNGRDEAWYEAKKADLPDWQLAQEYPDNPEEAFLRSGRPAFDVEMLKRLEAREPVLAELLRDELSELYFDTNGGPYKVWKMPEKGARYCIGADVAEGLEHGDFSVAYVIDAKTREVVASYHGHIDADLFGSAVLFNLGSYYNQALLGVESNNHGLSTLQTLRRLGYNPLYRQRPVNQRTQGTAGEILGWRTSNVSKPLAIDELNRSLRDGELHYWDREGHVELRSFVRDGDGKMHGSPHDDRVMSLAIANQMLKFVWLQEYRPVTTPPPGTFGWFEQKMFGRLGDPPKREYKDRPPIGERYARSAS